MHSFRLLNAYFQVEVDEERSRRHAAFEEEGPAAVKSFSEDGVPVRNKKYAAYKKDGQGRVEIPLAHYFQYQMFLLFPPSHIFSQSLMLIS